MEKLNEARLSRILKHLKNNEMCFISACRSENTFEENTKQTKALEKDIRNLGYSFIQVLGGYTENVGTATEKDVYEASLIVINNKDKTYNFNFAKEMLYLCNKYKQECILLKASEYKTAWYDANGKRISPFLINLSIHDFEKGFSKIHGQKFSLIEMNEEGLDNSGLKRSWSSYVSGVWLREAIERNIYDWEDIT